MKKILRLSIFGFSLMPFSLLSCSINENEYSPKYIKNKSFFFSNNVVKILESKIENQIFDNNFYLLNGILLTDNNINGNDAEYDFKSNEIFISSKNIKNKNWKNDETKAEYIFELLFHEYNHFLNKTYLNNLPNSDSQQTKQEIFKYINKNREPEIWNKYFLKQFKNILKYNTDTKLYSSELIKNKYVSLGSRYNQKNLFEIANGKDKPEYPKLKGNEIMSPLNYDKNLPIDDSYVIKGDKLSYLFSMQELVARKMQIINMKYKPFFRDQEGFDKNGWIFSHNQKIRWSPYLQDILNYKGGMFSKDLYLYDEPTLALSKLYESFVNCEAEVREIHYENNLKREGSNYFGKINKNKIAFSGVSKYDHKMKIGYLNEENFVEIPSKWINFKGKLQYHTSYIDKSNIINKPLAFKDSNKIIKMNNARSGNFGIVTTYDYFNSISDNLKVIKCNDFISIVEI